VSQGAVRFWRDAKPCPAGANAGREGIIVAPSCIQQAAQRGGQIGPRTVCAGGAAIRLVCSNGSVKQVKHLPRSRRPLRFPRTVYL